MEEARITLSQLLNELPKLDYESPEVLEQIEAYNKYPFKHKLPDVRQVRRKWPRYGKEAAS